jgi:hypothetical protein
MRARRALHASAPRALSACPLPSACPLRACVGACPHAAAAVRAPASAHPPVERRAAAVAMAVAKRWHEACGEGGDRREGGEAGECGEGGKGNASAEEGGGQRTRAVWRRS